MKIATRPRGGQAATLESVGKLAGVSRSTVSRVINASPGVSQKATDAVLEAIEQLGYVPNQLAKSLASKRTSVVTALIPEDLDRFFVDPFFSSIVTGIESYVSETDLVLNMMIASQKSFQKIVNSLAGGRADGLLVLSHHSDHELGESLRRKMPVVYGGRPTDDAADASYVDVDNIAAAKTAVEALLRAGCKKIGTITGRLDMPVGADRLQGFTEAVTEAGVAGPIVYGDFTAEGGREAARKLISGDQEFDGLFIASDLMARAAVDTLLESGLRVPEDVAVVGFDDSTAATSSHPYLTTIRQDPYDQGRAMAQLLSERMRNPEMPPRAVLLNTWLVERETT